MDTNIQEYYSKEICEAIAECAKDREVASVLASGKYAARPAIINYPQDVAMMVKGGATSFHGSIERWSTPMKLSTGMGKAEQDKLRIGWDFVIDLDCEGLEYAKLAADVFIRALQKHDIKNISVKFSGRRGFHIAVPFESFPQEIDFKPTASLYPDLPKKIAEYLKDLCKEPLRASLLEMGNENEPYKLVDVDIGVFASRHLFRMPYCLHGKSGLSSIPIDPKKVKEFELHWAKPENVIPTLKYMPRQKEDGSKLVRRAMFWHEYQRRDEPERKKLPKFEALKTAVEAEFFPPCIQKSLHGMKDGKKRSVFVLISFLRNLGWNPEQVETLLMEWNKKNPEHLQEHMIKGTIKSQYRYVKPLMAPNCDAEGYYKAYGVCEPDSLCKNIRNPVSYALAKRKNLSKLKGKKKVKKK